MNPFGSPDTFAGDSYASDDFASFVGRQQQQQQHTDADAGAEIEPQEAPLLHHSTSQEVVAAPPSSRANKPFFNGRVTIPTYSINGGMDRKFDPDKYPTALRGYLSEKAYIKLVEDLNSIAEQHRANNVDHAWLAAGALLLIPLAGFASRRKSRAVKRNKGFKQVFGTFNYENPHLRIYKDRTTRELVIKGVERE